MVVLLLVAIISGIAWLLGFLVFHVASASIHLLLLLAVACGVLALVMRTRQPHRRPA
jgi:hypothetical protein